jgi:hypothetical protein
MPASRLPCLVALVCAATLHARAATLSVELTDAAGQPLAVDAAP